MNLPRLSDRELPISFDCTSNDLALYTREDIRASTRLAADAQLALIEQHLREQKPVADVADGLLMRCDLPKGFTGSLYAAPLPASQGGGWISIEDRLPTLPEDDEDGSVMVYTWDGEFVAEDEFAPEYEQPAGPAVGGWVRTGEWFCNDRDSRVTHWMPRVLPAAPATTKEAE